MKHRRLIIPPGLTFWQAVQRGYVATIESERYMKWLHTLPCCLTGSRINVTVHHVVGHGLKPIGGKTTDLLAFPIVTELHLPNFAGGLHAIGHKAWEQVWGSQLEFSARTLMQAVYEGVLEL